MKDTGYWIKHSHLFQSDEYVCSECGGKSTYPASICPNCKAVMKGSNDDANWVDEANIIDIIIGD